MALIEKLRSPIRAGLIDTWAWGASMLVGATYDEWDIPVCPTSISVIPNHVISWTEAKALYKKKKRKGDADFYCDAFIHFYIDDAKFDGLLSSIWLWPKKAFRVIKHFGGVITPDFSTYLDFPLPVKFYNTYRMRTFGYWLTTKGMVVINNVRWGSRSTWSFDFSGIPKGSAVAIGTVGGSPRKLADRERFNKGFDEMLKNLQPTTIIVIGSANYSCFEKARALGIEVAAFESDTSLSYEEVSAYV